MNTVNCLVVDDEELARDLIATHLSQLENFKLVASCSSAIEASVVLKRETIDLMFLDIEMPVLKGTDFYKSLLIKPKVIFTTAYRDYAIDGFELDAIDYLLKPIVFPRFFQAIEKYMASERNKLQIDHAQNLEPQYIFVRENRKQVRLELNQIVYIQSLKDYVKIFLDNDSHIIKHGIGEFEKLLGSGFIRTHRSYIVNRNRVSALTKNDVELGDVEVPIGDSYKTNVIDAFGI